MELRLGGGCTPRLHGVKGRCTRWRGERAAGWGRSVRQRRRAAAGRGQRAAWRSVRQGRRGAAGRGTPRRILAPRTGQRHLWRAGTPALPWPAPLCPWRGASAGGHGAGPGCPWPPAECCGELRGKNGGTTPEQRARCVSNEMNDRRFLGGWVGSLPPVHHLFPRVGPTDNRKRVDRRLFWGSGGIPRNCGGARPARGVGYSLNRAGCASTCVECIPVRTNAECAAAFAATTVSVRTGRIDNWCVAPPMRSVAANRTCAPMWNLGGWVGL